MLENGKSNSKFQKNANTIFEQELLELMRTLMGRKGMLRKFGGSHLFITLRRNNSVVTYNR